MEINMKKIFGFLGRFTILHLITYVAFGLFFMTISNYSEVFTSPQVADFMRPTDDPMMALAIPMQIPRALLLGLALYPFRQIFVETKHGWLKLFFLMWVWTGIGAVITGPGSIEGFLYTKVSFGNPLIGLPEVTFQMFAFSGLLTLWEKRAAAKNIRTKRGLAT
jgi:hypothetical protein